MTPYHSDSWLTVWQGDCREVMAQMEPESVHCVVTSPPYWGLRDYGTATWLGGDDGCDHIHQKGGRNPETAGKQLTNLGTIQTQYATACRKCGAIHEDSQLGLEPTPEEYVANMVAVFREVRRVLRADGTCWVNLGDSYNANVGKGFNANARIGPQDTTRKWGKPKDLVGIPWRVAFALQADGWYLRSDIIWAKPNPMPESVTDRPTKAHEYLFLLSKSARYYYDADAVREPQRTDEQTFYAKLIKQPHKGQRGKDDVNDRRTTGGFQDATYNPNGRNLRSVWSIATQPYPGAHFATFPEALVEPCVKAGTSERGVCPECGAPWRRDVERKAMILRRSERTHPMGQTRSSGTMIEPPSSKTVGWLPSCDCRNTGGQYADNGPHRSIPATFLDPFAGSGTTGRVAQRLGRRAVLIDLNGEYLTQAMKRNADIPLGLEAG